MATITEQEHAAATTPARRAPRKLTYPQLFAVAGLIVLSLLALAISAISIDAHVRGEYQKRDDALAALRVQTARDTRAAQGAHVREIASLTAANKVALKKAVATQKKHDTRILQRVMRRQKARAAREAKAARNAGYSSGSAAGYANGRSTGVDEGLRRGSDSLDCSDDPDVTWLPYCF